MRSRDILFGLVCTFILTCGCDWSLNNPSDSKSSTYTVKSEASLSVSGRGPYYQFDTISFHGKVSSKSVEKADLVRMYEWDFGNDGTIDTTVAAACTMRIPVYTSGTYSVALRLTDRLGSTSEAVKSVLVLPRFRLDLVLPDFDIPIDTTCAFYAQSEYTMRPVVLLGRYITYRNKAESMELGNFIFELLKNITGTIDYNSLALPYKTGFSNGVYTLDNGSLTMKAAFLYGSTSENHRENDTVASDLFNPRSYIKSFTVQRQSPYYSYEPGPLWDLTDGFSVDVSNPLDPKVSLTISLGSLKFTGSREVRSRYTMSAEMGDSNQMAVPTFEAIAFEYHGVAKVDPFPVRDIVSRVEEDSLLIDMSGSVIRSDTFPIRFTIEKYRDTVSVAYNFQLTQEMLQQQVRFGTGGGNRKVAGSYIARSEVSVNDLTMVNSYFAGSYSTTDVDTACFFCDREMQTPFGSLYFDLPQSGYITFVSDRYAYQFVMEEGIVATVK